MAWIKWIIDRADFRGAFTLVCILFALPLGWGVFTGITVWLSPFVMLNSLFVLNSVVWLNGLAVLSLFLILWRKRWFCRNICPVGWGCDQVSKSRKGRGISIKRIPPVGRWMALSSFIAAIAGIPLFILLDPISVFNGFFVIFSKEFSLPILFSFLGLPLILAINVPFPGLWCSKLCPLGGMQDEMASIENIILKRQAKKKRVRIMASTGRRFFLVSGAGLAAGLLMPSFLKPDERRYLRPPGSVPEKRFNTLCIRCGNCIKSCPSGILVHHIDPQYILSWMVPEICFTNGYCLEKCNICSTVCPSGSITLFSKDVKCQLFIGLAEIKLENCLLAKNKECDRCKSACSYEAITIEGVDRGILMFPVVRKERCVGCGACEAICPPGVIEIVPVTER